MSSTIASPGRTGASASLMGLLRPDGIVLLLPTAIGMRGLNINVALLMLFGLAVLALLRKPVAEFRLATKPLVFILAAAVVVIARPDFSSPSNPYFPIITLFLVGLTTILIVRKIDARTVIISLMNGCGLYCLANVALYAVGIRGATSASRIGGLVEATGSVRVLYPLALTINAPSAIAALFVATLPFVFRSSTRPWRAFQMAALAAALVILVTAGSVAAVVSMTLVTVTVILFPAVIRWLGQITVLLAVGSVFVVPPMLRSGIFSVDVIRILAPNRSLSQESLTSIQGRDRIWDSSLRYWETWVDDSQRLIGFGTGGHYRSGASATYADFLVHLLRNPERTGMHNAYLQQLFDGGLIGSALLAVGVFWVSVRLARSRTAWAMTGTAAIVALTVLNVGSITEAYFAPGPGQEPFWILIVLAGISCQKVAVVNLAEPMKAAGDTPTAPSSGARSPQPVVGPGRSG